MSRFDNLKNKIFEIEIDGEKVKVKPKVEKAEIFLLMKKNMTELEAKRMTNLIVETVKEANPEVDIEDIKADVATHYGEYLKKLSILYGFATEEDFNKLKDEAKNELGQ